MKQQATTTRRCLTGLALSALLALMTACKNTGILAQQELPLKLSKTKSSANLKEKDNSTLDLSEAAQLIQKISFRFEERGKGNKTLLEAFQQALLARINGKEGVDASVTIDGKSVQIEELLSKLFVPHNLIVILLQKGLITPSSNPVKGLEGMKLLCKAATKALKQGDARTQENVSTIESLIKAILAMDIEDSHNYKSRIIGKLQADERIWKQISSDTKEKVTRFANDNLDKVQFSSLYEDAKKALKQGDARTIASRINDILTAKEDPCNYKGRIIKKLLIAKHIWEQISEGTQEKVVQFAKANPNKVNFRLGVKNLADKSLSHIKQTIEYYKKLQYFDLFNFENLGTCLVGYNDLKLWQRNTIAMTAYRKDYENHIESLADQPWQRMKEHIACQLANSPYEYIKAETLTEYQRYMAKRVMITKSELIEAIFKNKELTPAQRDELTLVIDPEFFNELQQQLEEDLQECPYEKITKVVLTDKNKQYIKSALINQARLIQAIFENKELTPAQIRQCILVIDPDFHDRNYYSIDRLYVVDLAEQLESKCYTDIEGILDKYDRSFLVKLTRKYRLELQKTLFNNKKLQPEEVVELWKKMLGRIDE